MIQRRPLLIVDALLSGLAELGPPSEQVNAVEAIYSQAFDIPNSEARVWATSSVSSFSAASRARITNMGADRSSG